MSHSSKLPASLIVPGYKGSGPGHWQSWLEERLPGSRRLQGVDWHSPVLAHWAGQVRQELRRQRGPQWIVAHSFGCLAAVTAVADLPARVAGVLLVAPADPLRFDFLGLRDAHADARCPTLETAVPRRALGVPGLLIASRNDPWLSFERASDFAGAWGLPLLDAGPAGHLNEQSGHGPWPALHERLLDLMRDSPATLPMAAALGRGRGSVLASVRQKTRRQLENF